MKKLKEYLYIWYEGKSIRGIHVSPCDIYLLTDIYNAKVAHKRFEFIQANVKAVLDKCGIATVEKGIGWEVV